MNVIFGDEVLVQNVRAVRRRAAALPAEARFHFLSDWVLPNGRRDTIRLQVTFTPTHPIESSGAESFGTKRDAGGRMVSPALDLVEAARQTNRLDELFRTVEAVPDDTLIKQKNRLALLTVILLQQGRITEALDRIDQFLVLSAQDQPGDVDHRSAEAVLFHAGRKIPEVREAMINPLNRISRDQMVKNIWTIWNRQFRTLIAKDDADDSEVQEMTTSSAQWKPAGNVSAETRGSGIPPSRWNVQPGQADDVVSHADEYLYFQSPLRGNFQIECDLTSFGWTDTELMVCGTWVSPVYTLKHCDIGDVRNTYRRIELSPMLSRIRNRMHYRTEVRDRTATTSVNGRPLHSQPLSDAHDPWVAIRNDYKNSGSASNVRVTGEPVIPDEIGISVSDHLEGWLPYFGGSVGWSHSHWQPLYRGERESDASAELKSAGGLFASRAGRLPAGCYQEEALFYHRPMLEDGVITYEFFYRDGELAAHPAIDRLCLLVEPSGARVHWLTDGIYDRTETSPDNASAVAGGQPIALRNNAWNRAKVSLRDDVIGLEVNGRHVCRQRLNADNQRRFGFFHFADQSELRVRNVRWKGDWPRSLPTVSEQDLAVDDADFLDRNIDHLTAVFHHDFAKGGVFNEQFTIVHGAADVQVMETPSGALAIRQGVEGYRDTAISPNLQVHGDFDITVRYSDFQYRTSKGGSSSLILTAILENTTSDEFTVTRRHMHAANGEQDLLQCIIVQRVPEGAKRDYFVTEPMEERSGRLRLARRGDQVYFLTAEGNSPNFRLRGVRPFSTDPITANGIRLVNQVHQPGMTGVLWKDITVKSEKLSTATVADAD